MKKLGFTLAEVLITLGIIGVVAALTAPALVQNTGNAKVGPTLAKVVAALENANGLMMMEQGIDDLSKLRRTTYEAELLKRISGSSTASYELDSSTYNPTPTCYNANDCQGHLTDSEPFYFSKDILLVFIDDEYTNNYKYDERGSYKGFFRSMYIDINGGTTGPNVVGKDIFHFLIDKGGSVIPDGGVTYAYVKGEDDDLPEWHTTCNEDTVTNGDSCAGSIFDNNLRVIYQ